MSVTRRLLLFGVGLVPLVFGCASDEQGTLVLRSAPFPQIQGRTSEVTARLEVGGGLCSLTVEADTTLSGSCPDLPLGTHSYTLTYLATGGAVLATASGTVVINAGDNGPVAIAALNTEYDDDTDGCLNIEAFTGKCLTFAPKVDLTTGKEPQSVAIGHLNNDQWLDLAVANSGAESVSILLGNGDGSFEPKTDIPTGDVDMIDVQSRSLALGDLNRDGSLDLVVANEATDRVVVLIGMGDGSFEPRTEYEAGDRPRFVAVGDVNADGNPDVGVANMNSNTVSVFMGDGTGVLAPKSDFPTGARPRSVAMGDLNGDAKGDLVVGNVNASSISILLGTGDGSFDAKSDYETGDRPRFVAIRDLNGDGTPDVATVSELAHTVSVLLGTGNGSFGSRTDYPTGTSPISIAVEDLNGDGTLDLAVTSEASATISVLAGTRTGSFRAKRDFATGAQPHSVAVGDINGDGKPDLAVANFLADSVSILLNTTIF